MRVKLGSMLPEAVSTENHASSEMERTFALAHASEVDGPTTATQFERCASASRRCESKGESLARLNVASVWSKEPVRTLNTSFTSSSHRIFDGPGLSNTAGGLLHRSLLSEMASMPITARASDAICANGWTALV